MTPNPSPTVLSLLTQRIGCGQLQRRQTKPFSIHFRDTTNAVLAKIYRIVSPFERQARELDALALAPAYGVRVPEVIDHGVDHGLAWTAMAVVDGTPLAIHSGADAETFSMHATALMRCLQAHCSPIGSGPGWSDHATGRISDLLVRQLSERIRAISFWSQLIEHLRELDGLSAVYLHGDIKPEHILVDDGTSYLVDWESSARGPAVLDHADMLFHALRDAIYEEVAGRDLEMPGLDHAGHAVALGWRVLLWLDRRHATVDESVANLMQDAASLGEGPSGIERAVEIINKARWIGTAY